ncbi:HIT family protein [Leifsonia aquatica]|uniref:HIT family protein n=1 Tax=Leifsonia aquatica TaxID=144185 RepID=UPI0038119C26
MTQDTPDCPFCEIVARTDPDAREIYRDADTVAFFPTEPAVIGHTLVIPRRHVPDIWELDAGTAQRLTSTTVKIANAIKDALHPDGLNIIQSNGRAATQTVMHVHIHVVPRWENDRIGRIWPPESHYTNAEKDEAWDVLRQAVRGLSAS